MQLINILNKTHATRFIRYDTVEQYSNSKLTFSFLFWKMFTFPLNGNVTVCISSQRFHFSHGFHMPWQVFAYDYCFWSMDESDKEKFAGWLVGSSNTVQFILFIILNTVFSPQCHTVLMWVFVFVWTGQEVVFQCLGESLLHNAFQGYNACIFAYGQTGKLLQESSMLSGQYEGNILLNNNNYRTKRLWHDECTFFFLPSWRQ